MSEGEKRHPGWVLKYPGRATFGVRAATVFILPKTEDVQIYSRWGGAGFGAAAKGKLRTRIRYYFPPGVRVPSVGLMEAPFKHPKIGSLLDLTSKPRETPSPKQSKGGSYEVPK